MAGPIESAVIDYCGSRKKFRLADVVEQTALPRRKVMRVLDKFCKLGLLEQVDDKRDRICRAGDYGPPRRNTMYQVMSAEGFEKRKSPRNSISGQCRDRIWRSLRVVRMTTMNELIQLTGCNKWTVDDYIKLLKRDGYIRAAATRKNRQKVWVLIKDAGAKRPDIPEVKDG